MPPTPESDARRTLHRRTLVLPGVDPGVFLDAFSGELRGFWGRGDRWVAWAGALHEIVEPGTLVNGEVEPARRFSRVRARARNLLTPGSGTPRFFGGFSFLDDPGTDGAWEGFPAARFILPRITLAGRKGRIELVVQALGTDTPPPGLEGELQALGDTLRREPTPPRVLVPRPVERISDEEEVEHRAWKEAVAAVLGAIATGEVEKAVLARIQEVDLDRAPGTGDLVRYLRHENPRAHVFLFGMEGGRTLFGAAPEVLAEFREGRLHSTAVAGSAARGGDPESDRARADALLASAKDREEHRMTVEQMSEVLDPRLDGMEVAEEPRILTLARIQHLESPIEGTGREGEDVLSLVEALHPTPAVCGRPRDAALSLIGAREPFARGWYAGPVGWFDVAGEGDFVPALRIGVGRGLRWRLYAGAGIVAGSDPELEWEETRLKFEPALRALRAGADAPADTRDG